VQTLTFIASLFIDANLLTVSIVRITLIRILAGKTIKQQMVAIMARAVITAHRISTNVSTVRCILGTLVDIFTLARVVR
jgi:hypothetical protein